MLENIIVHCRGAGYLDANPWDYHGVVSAKYSTAGWNLFAFGYPVERREDGVKLASLER